MNEIAARAERLRRFNRFYTGKIGVLQEGLLNSPFSLAEARVIYEIANGQDIAAAEVGKRLNLDAGYLSRIVQRLMKAGIVSRVASKEDGRARLLSLTRKGRAQFAILNQRSHDEAAGLLRPLSAARQRDLMAAFDAAETILGAPPSDAPLVLRPHRLGDMGWVLEQHGAVYGSEYGWNERFEALVAEVIAEFLAKYDPQRERCWIAERAGERIGSIFLVRKSERVAKLRLLLVTAQTRGLGAGRRLVDECLAFARQVGYREVVLWTNTVLVSARRIYEAAGFELVEETPNNDFGPKLTAQVWRKVL
jgi:DNA-binding MarR family transcriptional regulator/N-acetylglutamate synthase-like GNAT family acetyltransferase